MHREHALVLSGGASRGAWQLGYAEGLIDIYGAQYEPDVYVGTSVGGLMAAYLAMFPTFRQGVAAYADLWERRVRKNSDIYTTWGPRWTGLLGCIPALSKGSLYTARALRNIIREELLLHEIRESGKGLILTTVDLVSGGLALYDEQTLTDWRPVYATAAFPMAFEPIWLGEDGSGGYAVDGGLRDVTPLSAGIDTGASRIDVLWTSRERPMRRWERPDGPTRMYAIARRELDILLDEVLQNDIKACRRVNTQVAQGRADPGKRHIDLSIWRPRHPHVGSSLDFAAELWQKNRARGRDQAREDHKTSIAI